MLVLFDHGAPRGLARSLTDHTVKEARAQGWDTPGNGALLAAAENAGFEVLVTPGKNIRYQQNLAGRKIAIVVLSKCAMADSLPARSNSRCGSERRKTGELQGSGDTRLSAARGFAR